MPREQPSVDEYELVDPQDPTHQGDVMVGLTEERDFAALIVVTADCDISYNKFGGRLTALPVISLGDYLRDFWLERELLSLRRQLAASITEDMRRLIAESPRDFGSPTPERLLSWPLETNRQEMARSLDLPDNELTQVYDLVDVVHRIDRNGEGASLRSKWRACCDAMFANGMKTHDKARTALVKRITSELPRNLPGDVLYLNAPMPTAESGFVALARFPVEIDPLMIAHTGFDEVYGEAKYRRVARLASPFRYRLTQLFAEVYSAIGLPDQYEAKRGAVFERLAEEIDRELWS